MALRRNFRLVLINLLLAFFLSACHKEKVPELSKTTLEKDTLWQGTLVLGGDVYVPPGVTLTIAPGTVVKFRRIDEKSDQNMFGVDSPYYPQAEIIVRGRLIARGKPDRHIVFTSAELEPRAGDWGAVNFLGSEGNEIEYAKILCAYNGVHAHGAEVSITHSEFVKNGVAVSFKSEEETPGVPWFGKRSRLKILHNVITKNKGGIGFRNSSAEIAYNEITDNKFFGLWPKEDLDVFVHHNNITENRKGVYLYQAKGVRFRENNIYDNREYNIAPAEAQDFPVDMKNNWFGTDRRDKVEETIFDGNDDPDLAPVLIDPMLQEKVRWENSP